METFKVKRSVRVTVYDTFKATNKESLKKKLDNSPSISREISSSNIPEKHAGLKFDSYEERIEGVTSVGERARDIIKKINDAHKEAEKLLCDIVKEKDGFIPMIPMHKPAAHIIVNRNLDCAYNADIEEISVYGLRYVEGEGLMLLTRDGLSDYEFENDYTFEFCDDDEYLSGQDWDRMNDVLKDESHFTTLEDANAMKNESIIALLNIIDYYA